MFFAQDFVLPTWSKPYQINIHSHGQMSLNLVTFWLFQLQLIGYLKVQRTEDRNPFYGFYCLAAQSCLTLCDPMDCM